MPLYRRNKTYWLSSMKGGRRIRISLKTENRALAVQRALEHEASLQQTDGLYTKTPLADCLERYCQLLDRTYSPRALPSLITILRGCFGPCCPGLQPPMTMQSSLFRQPKSSESLNARFVEDISPHDVSRLVNSLANQRGWSVSTVRHWRIALHGFFEYCRKHEGVKFRHINPATAISVPKKTYDPEISFLTHEQIDEQLAALESNQQVRTMVAVMIHAGLRLGEVVHLQQQDIDYRDGRPAYIRIRPKTWDPDLGRAGSWRPKTGKNRIVPIQPCLSEILLAYRPHQSDHDWLFPSPKGKLWSERNFTRRLSLLNQAAGLDWTCLDFRHTFGSLLAQKGFSLFQISALMGNSPEICRRHYAALNTAEMTLDLSRMAG